MKPIFYLIVLSVPSIAGCQKTSEKFGYDPPDDLTAHNNGLKETGRWVPCTEVCLAKEIPRIRNAVLDVQNVTRNEFESLKRQLQDIRDLSDQRGKALQEQINKAGNSEREINLTENINYICSPQSSGSHRESCKNAFENEKHFLVDTTPAFIGFARPNYRLHAKTFTVSYGERPKRTTTTLNPTETELRNTIDTTSKVTVSPHPTLRILTSNHRNCANSLTSNSQLLWEVNEQFTTHTITYSGGVSKEWTFPTFGSYYRCFGIQFMNIETPVRIFDFRVIGMEKPDF